MENGAACVHPREMRRPFLGVFKGINWSVRVADARVFGGRGFQMGNVAPAVTPFG